MVGKEQNHHRPGGLWKQSNKAHNSGAHRSKNSLNKEAKGKINVKSLTKKRKHELSRDQRRHQANQLRQNKRYEALAEKRLLGNAPLLIALVPLNVATEPQKSLKVLLESDPNAEITTTSCGVTHVFFPSLKKNLSFITTPYENSFATLDALKVCDTVVLLVSTRDGFKDPETCISDWGRSVLTEACGQGLPTPTIVLTDTQALPTKKIQKCKTDVADFMSRWIPNEKVLTLNGDSDCKILLRRIAEQKRWKVGYRDRRPHIYAEKTEFIPCDGSYGTLKVTGYLRGGTLCVDRLVHLPGLGDFQLEQIDQAVDPCNTKRTSSENKILFKCDPNKQDSLDSEQIPEVELEEEPPKEDEPHIEEDSSEDEEDENDDAMSVSDSDKSDEDDEDDMVSQAAESTMTIDEDKYDKEQNYAKERQEYEKIKDDAEYYRNFPDEVETPLDQPARVRFQKYQGLESFTKSPWDPNYKIPSDYQRILKYRNFNQWNKIQWKNQSAAEGAQSGTYVTVHVKNVSNMLWTAFEKIGSPLILFGLLKLEHFMTVLNIKLERTAEYKDPIKSKDQLVFQCGFRRFVNNPIFSEHTHGNKFKLEKYFDHGCVSVATMYGRTQFLPAPVLCYKIVDGKSVLVAKGSLISCSPDRIVLKKAVLTGRHYHIFKHYVIVRFMFFDRKDIEYFKKIKISTRPSRLRGDILQPLGSHGHMKCAFNKQLPSQDVITLSLYKRAFPKWTYEDLLVDVVETENMES